LIGRLIGFPNDQIPEELMTETLTHIDAAPKRWNLLEHSFYQRWSAGTLTRGELVDYAGQYAHVVAGLPRWLEAAADSDPEFGDQLRRHARDESAHVAMWDRFSAAVAGVAVVAEPNAATAELLRRCDELTAAGRGAAVAWALETQTPAVSAAKLAGLREHYDIDERNGGEYFEVHRTLDIEHEAELRTVMAAEPVPTANAAAADVVLEGLWALLSSVDKPA
jgi:pyrroloquinoline-quinone synthase